MYKIKLNNIKFRAHIGVLPEEKVLGQNLEIDLIVETNFDYTKVLRTAQAGLAYNELDETLSYVDFYEATKAVVESSKADLIEHVAFEIIQAVKATSERISTVEVHLRKLAVPIEMRG